MIPLILLFVFVLLSCGSKISLKNYEKIKNGMTKAQVIEILGEPTESSGIDIGVVSGDTSIWEGEKEVITIQFFNGEVRAKTFAKKPQS
jgi:hypothetical protein